MDAPLGMDALAHPWPETLLYAFPPVSLILHTLSRIGSQRVRVLLIAPLWPGRTWTAEIVQLLYSHPMASSSAQRYPLSGRGENFSSTSGEVESLGLACERSNLNALGLPQNVISTIQSARTDSTRSLYEEKWKRFETWCQERYHFFHQCRTSLPSFRRC